MLLIFQSFMNYVSHLLIYCIYHLTLEKQAWFCPRVCTLQHEWDHKRWGRIWRQDGGHDGAGRSPEHVPGFGEVSKLTRREFTILSLCLRPYNGSKKNNIIGKWNKWDTHCLKTGYYILNGCWEFSTLCYSLSKNCKLKLDSLSKKNNYINAVILLAFYIQWVVMVLLRRNCTCAL